ncbi:uncharacterized protein LOC124432142 [Vespa crabro]|uniref:uncharacterized protein LOC124432142 n=1 Tax=Vespa crabro TaxID=7445 RepID=UPI001F02F398|nr:uncharacterized protein LOC124432142 [Vespa crabro]
MSCRKGLMGRFIWQACGKRKDEKNDPKAEALRNAVQGTRVIRPLRTSTMILVGLDAAANVTVISNALMDSFTIPDRTTTSSMACWHSVYSGVCVEIKTSVKHLGKVIESRMLFRPNFEALIPKAEVIPRCRRRLLPKLHGPGKRKQRLHSCVIHSVIHYGAPDCWRT